MSYPTFVLLTVNDSLFIILQSIVTNLSSRLSLVKISVNVASLTSLLSEVNDPIILVNCLLRVDVE